MKNLENKSALVVGATGGLGQETVKELIREGVGTIYVSGRTLEKTEKVKQAIVNTTPLSSRQNIISVGGFDMLKPDQIKSSILNLDRSIKFDMIFLGAGGVIIDKDYQTNSYNGKKVEKTLFQNVIGAHFVLKHLIENNLLAENARILYAGGEGARGISGLIESPDYFTPETFRKYVYNIDAKPYNMMNAIGVSKFFGALWTTIASKKYPKLSIFWFSPGLTYGTQGLRDAPPIKRFMMDKIGFRIMALFGLAQSPNKGGQKNAKALVGRVGKSGDILGAPEKKALGEIQDQKPMNPLFTDVKMITEAERIFTEISGGFA